MTKTLSRTATALALASALLVGGCDREKGADGQPSDSTKSAEDVANATNAGANADDGTVPDVSGAPEPASKEGKARYEIDRNFAGKPLADISFTGDDDAPISLADFKGKPLLLNLWATWCIPCVTELPMLDALAAKQAGKLQVITVSQDIKGAELVDPFFAKHGYKTIKPYLDPENKLTLGLQARGLPATILFDKDGKELWRLYGDPHWDSPEAQKLLAEAGI